MENSDKHTSHGRSPTDLYHIQDPPEVREGDANSDYQALVKGEPEMK